MKPLTFALREEPGTWLDLSALTPDKLDGRSRKAIAALRLRCGRRTARVDDLFEISGADSTKLRFRNASGNFVRLGHGMNTGSIEVSGHAGHYLGQGLRGGRISVRGNAGNWLGTGMSGGRIELSGDAGDFLGAAVSGETQGMSGGVVIIGGNAGKRLGDRMRRGTVLVLGNTGHYTGSRMIAGTIMVLGRSAAGIGHDMRRGSIITGRMPAHLYGTFSDCGEVNMDFLRLLFKQTAAIDKRLGFFRDFGPEVRRFAGDQAAGGKGEILVMLNAPRPQVAARR